LNGLFGRSPAYLSTIYLDIVRHIVETFWGFLAWNPRLDNYERLRRLGRAVDCRTGLGVDRAWGFADRTFRPFCKPTRDEHLNYSVHKRRHGFKYQAIATPDGLVSSLSEPYRATENDWSMRGESGIQDRLRQVGPAFLPSLLTATNDYIKIYEGQEPLYIYSHPAYHNSYGVLPPYPSLNKTAEQEYVNRRMTRARICVENAFGTTANL
jgi:hypothetical protein